MPTMSVYAWGANSHGQLGLGFESELSMTPQLLPKCSFQANCVRSIRGGGGHVLVLDQGGRVHACGWNNRGQLGLDSAQECHNEFQCIPSVFFQEAAVEYIACGWDISGCITATKRLYVWGSNAFQQLGICQRAFNCVRRPLPVILPRGETPLRISFGLQHCAILTEDHTVYVFGRLRIADPPPGELTVSVATLNRATGWKVQSQALKELRINAVRCGQNHLLLKVCDIERGTGSRRVIPLGDNKFGQGNAFQFEEDVKQLAVGWTHNAVLLKDNRLLCWGRNCYGQLGIGRFTENQPMPTEVQLPSEACPARVHLGSEHALVRTTAGDVYTWGWNEHGNCGNNSVKNICTPTSIDLPAPCRLAGTGAGFCYAICESI